jgi:iron complex transport system ATP-binding protein
MGLVLLEGRAINEWTSVEMARTIGHLPQIVRGDLAFSAEQLVLMGRYPFADGWFESASDEDAVTEAMLRCDCLHLRRRSVATLSGGERQRVLVAACLAQQPKLLLLDEPATFLDVDQQLHCFQVLREETDRGMACLAVTHDLNLALTFCTRVLVLADKGVARDVAARDALDDPEWLRLFSSRLEATTTPSGRPWVWYE